VEHTARTSVFCFFVSFLWNSCSLLSKALAYIMERGLPGGSSSQEQIVVVKDQYGLQRRVKLYREEQLLPIGAGHLRSHALNLFDALGDRRCVRPVPEEKEALIRWIVTVQDSVGCDSASITSLGSIAGGGASSPLRVTMASSPSPLGSSGFGGSLASRSPEPASPYRTSPPKFILEESHSKQASLLARQNPPMTTALLREIDDGLQKFHNGTFGEEIWLAQTACAKDIFEQLHLDKDGSFLYFKDKFLNFSVVVGNISFSGDIPCFRYKVAYPKQFCHLFEAAYVSIFFTLKETEARLLLR